MISLDHLVLTVKDLDKTISFYTKVLGMTKINFGPNGERQALQFGTQKINLHQLGQEFKPHALSPTVNIFLSVRFILSSTQVLIFTLFLQIIYAVGQCGSMF